jgi:arylsulfatase A-like enzyme
MCKKASSDDTLTKQPNILLFLPDGMQAQVTSPDHDCLTPNIDRLAEGGLRFARAHTVLPTCSPSRASLMTGVLPHNHGVLQVEHCADEDQCVLRTEYPHWAQRLSQAGYRTGYFGKWHIERANRVEDFGWQVNGTHEGSAFRALGTGSARTEDLLTEDCLALYETGPEGYNRILHCGVTDVASENRTFAATTEMALDFIEGGAGQSAPWVCCASFSEPNTPLIAGRQAFERYDLDAISLPESLRDEMAASPGFYRRQRAVFSHWTDRQWQETRAVYYALITELDAQLGRLLDALDRSGQRENTIVVVTADHGRYMGAHGLDAHNFGAFEEAYNVPLIIAGPGVASGEVTDALVSSMSLGPTLLDLAGADPLDAADSSSFAPLLRDPGGAAEDFDTCYAEFFGTRFWVTQRVLWQGLWKLVFNGFDYDELYNLDEDPHELHNLGTDPAYEDIRRSMMAEIWRIAHQTRDNVLLETHYAPMRFAAVGPNAGLM